MKLPGLSFTEVLSGHYWRLDAPVDERAMQLELRGTIPDAAAFLRDKTLLLTGTIDAEQLASAQKIEGTVHFKLLGERRIPYRCTFRGDDGRRYELFGDKEWNGLAPLESVTLLAASLYDDAGDEVARATLRFDLRADWSRWLASARLVMG
ncbi:MAG TPA: hypothetical protein VK841_13550 [Polyangiaceae bacterium]|nr:hypothetical protein [Polyangiaceae bacterium]